MLRRQNLVCTVCITPQTVIIQRVCFYILRLRMPVRSPVLVDVLYSVRGFCSLHVFRIASLPSAGLKQTPWLFDCLVLLHINIFNPHKILLISLYHAQEMVGSWLLMQPSLYECLQPIAIAGHDQLLNMVKKRKSRCFGHT